MQAATPRTEVEIRELNTSLRDYIDRVRNGEELIVTDRGRPVARLTPLDPTSNRLPDLVATGIVRPPLSGRARYLPERRITANGTVTDLVAEQRR